MKIKSNYFYSQDFSEIDKYKNESLRSLHILNNSSKNIGKFNNEIVVDNSINIFDLSKLLNPNKYNQIFLIDIIENTENIFKLLNGLKNYLEPGGKLIISSINPKWYPLIKLTEAIKLKRPSNINSYIHKKKIEPTLSSAGFSVLNSYSRQIFPFYIFGFGKAINLFFELIFSFLNIGIKSYFVLQNENLHEFESKSKSVIVPAKNESENLPILFEKLNDLNLKLEIILIYGKSIDGTEKICKEIENKYQKNKYLSVKTFMQSTNGKGEAVFEAIKLCSGDYIAILDSDISVEPIELVNFFEIIENRNVDFVNGTRLITGIESGSMRFL